MILAEMKLTSIDLFKIMEEASKITETGTYDISDLGCVTPWGLIKSMHVLIYANGGKDVEVVVPQKPEHLNIDVSFVEHTKDVRNITKKVPEGEEK